MATNPTAPIVTLEMLAATSTTPNGGPRTTGRVQHLVVRPATADDLPAINVVLESCHLAMVDDLSPTVLVAVRDNTIVGCIQAINTRPCGLIMLMAVLPAYRHGRTALKLIEAAELTLRLQGCPAWQCLVRGDRHEWMETIRAWGATETDRNMRVFRKEL